MPCIAILDPLSGFFSSDRATLCSYAHSSFFRDGIRWRISNFTRVLGRISKAPARFLLSFRIVLKAVRQVTAAAAAIPTAAIHPHIDEIEMMGDQRLLQVG